MKAKRTSELGRRLRYLRRHRRANRAVSPVVATLILILIAVAAAAALYLWLVAWQGNITGIIGKPGAQYTVTVGGSTSVYPFSSLGAQWFDANNSNIVVHDSQGGTGAGMLAVCQGHIDVGQASSPQTVSGLQANDGCPASDQVTITTIAYDAVDIVLPKANPMGIVSMNQTTLLGIYMAASTTTPFATYAQLGLTVGTQLPPGWPAPGTGVTWNLVPTTANCASWGTCTLSTDTAAVHTYGRSDTSGTEQTFTSRLLGFTGTTSIATTVSGLGFGGCGSDGQTESCGITATHEANGNPLVISGVAGDAAGIGFASDGLARATSSGVIIVPFDGPGQTCASGSSCSNGGVLPTLGSSGTIAAGITGSTTTPNYVGWRPFEFVTLNPPTGEVERYFQFILDPQNNINLATASAEISIYSV